MSVLLDTVGWMPLSHKASANDVGTMYDRQTRDDIIGILPHVDGIRFYHSDDLEGLS